VSSVGRVVSSAAGRLRARPQADRAGYAFCATDSFWFRPAYTDGRCPLCGAVAAGGAPPAPRLRLADRSWLGMAGLALESLVMLALVLVMYFKG
jgi:hypothetical protein